MLSTCAGATPDMYSTKLASRVPLPSIRTLVLGGRMIGSAMPNPLSARSDRSATVATRALSQLYFTTSPTALRCGASQQARYTSSSNSLHAR